MKLIEDVYHDGYQPKLDINNYAYYVDDTNKGIMHKMARQYLNKLPNVNVEKQLNTYNLNLNNDACVVYFESKGLSYDSLDLWDLDNTYAADHNYNVIKITEPQSLITMD
jgi:hypothetical protein